MDSLLDWLQILTLIVVAVAAVGLIAFGYFRSSRPPSSEWPRLAGQISGGHDGRTEFLSELKNASDAILSDLDARVTSTRELLREADERIAALTDLLARLEQTASSEQRNGGRRSKKAEADRQAGDSTDLNGRRNEHAGRKGLSGNTEGSPASHEDVRALAREGKRPEEIAKALGIGTGEVLLILGLSRRRS